MLVTDNQRPLRVNIPSPFVLSHEPNTISYASSETATHNSHSVVSIGILNCPLRSQSGQTSIPVKNRMKALSLPRIKLRNMQQEVILLKCIRVRTTLGHIYIHIYIVASIKMAVDKINTYKQEQPLHLFQSSPGSFLAGLRYPKLPLRQCLARF